MRAPPPRLFLGPVEGPLTEAAAAAVFVRDETTGSPCDAMDGAGDLDGDGLQDVILGDEDAPETGSGKGAAYLVLAPFSGTISLPTGAASTLLGGIRAGHAGSAVTAAGDPTGDGVSDLLVSAWDADATSGREGIVYVVPGGGP